MGTMEIAFLVLVLVSFTAFCLGLAWGVSHTDKPGKGAH